MVVVVDWWWEGMFYTMCKMRVIVRVGEMSGEHVRGICPDLVKAVF